MTMRKTIKHLPSITKTFHRFSSSLSVLSTEDSKSDTVPCSLLKQDPIDICLSIWVIFLLTTHSHFPESHWLPLKIRSQGTSLSTLLRPCNWYVSSAQCYPFPHSSFPSYPPKSRRSRPPFKWNNKIQQLIRGPNHKPSTSLISKKKLQAMLKSSEPCFQDRVVQEVLLMILEPIFEPRFSRKSDAFRPGRSAQTIIRTIRRNFAGYLWFLRGDLSELFDNVDVNVIMNSVEK